MTDPPSATLPRPVRGRSTGTGQAAASPWPCYAAAAAAFSFAAVSFYWALGGLAGLSSLGDDFKELARARDPTLITIVWITAVLKAAVGALALALVQPWGARLPRRWLLLLAWGCAAILILYGLLQEASVALVMLDVITPAEPADPTVLRWRLLLWEPWFVVWGVLLGLAARYAHKRPEAA